MRAIAFIFISFFSSFGDTLFLSGVPLYFFRESGGSITETALLPIVITLAVLFSRKLIFKLNKMEPLKLTAYGELSMGIIELILLGIVAYAPSKWVVLAGTIPMAIIYNIYAPAKFLRIQEHFFGDKVFYLTTWQSAVNRLGNLLAVFLSGWIVVNYGITGILAADCASFFIFGGFALLYLRLSSKGTSAIENRKVVNPEIRTLNFEKRAFIWILPLISFSTLFLTWDRSSSVAVASSVTSIPLDDLSMTKALIGAAGIGLGILLGKFGERPGFYAWFTSLILATLGVTLLGNNTQFASYMLFFMGGLISCIAIPVQKSIYSHVSRLGGDDKAVSTGHWIYNSTLNLLLMPIGLLADKAAFINALQVSCLALITVGFLGGTLVFKILKGVPK